MKNHKRWYQSFSLPIAAVLVGLAGQALPVRADQLIYETFTGGAMRDTAPIGGDTALGGTNAGFSWTVYAINNGVLTDYTHTNGYNANNPSYASAGFIVPGVTNSGTGNSTPCLLWTNTTVRLHDCIVTNISFMTRNNSSNTTEQIVVRVAGQWYATTNLFRDRTGNAGSFALNSYVFARQAYGWQTLNTNDLTLGGALTGPLPDGDLEAVGVYGLVSVNSGTATSKIRLDNFLVEGIPPGPPILSSVTASPAETVAAPTTVTLSVAATGVGPFGYQWRKGEANLVNGPSGTGSTRSGALTSQLVISSTTTSDSGEYDVVVSNAYGSSTSAVSVVTITSLTLPPTIDTIVTVPASGISEAGGAPMSITVTASGTGPFGYQWRKGLQDLQGETSSTLTLPSSFSSSGAYSVVVTNSVGSVTSTPPVTLTVVDTTAPVLTFIGGTSTNVAINTGYQLPGYNLDDNSGEVPVVTVSGTVNMATPGSYQLAFKATDSSNNSSTNFYVVNVVLIRESFDQAVIDNSPVAAAPGWSAYAYNVLTGGVVDYSSIGADANLPTISQAGGALGSDGRPGFLVAGEVSRVNTSFLWLDTAALLQSFEVTNLTFYTKNNSSGSQTRITVRVNTTWYVSTATFSDTTANASWALQSFDFNRDAASWLEFDPVTLTVGAPLSAPLPNQSISGLGFFCNIAAGKIRIDSIIARGQPASFAPTAPVAGPVTVSPLNPADGTAWKGLPLTFKVAVVGTAPLNYSWRKDGQPIPGATTNPWVIESPSGADNGSYDVVVSSGNGSSTSAAVPITVSDLSLAMNEHFNQSTNDPGVLAQAPGWHVLAINRTNSVVTDFTSSPLPPWNADFPNLARSFGADYTMGYFVFGEDADVGPVFLWNEGSSLLQNSELKNVQFYTRNSFFSATVQLAVRVGTQWYVSTTPTQDTTINTYPFQLQNLAFTTDAGLWQKFDETTFAMGEFNSEPLPVKGLTGIGFYSDTVGVAGAKNRIDEIRLGVLAPDVPAVAIQPVYKDASGNLVVRVPTSAGWQYVLEGKQSLGTPSAWTAISTNAGTGGVITNLVPVNAGSSLFLRYRLQ